QRGLGRQVPSRQDSAVSQASAQPPQLSGSLAISISQPSSGSPLQSSKPAAHSKLQLPAEQSATVLGGVGQALPHSPQCSGDESRSTHAPPHSVRPEAQSGPASSPGPPSIGPASMRPASI